MKWRLDIPHKHPVSWSELMSMFLKNRKHPLLARSWYLGHHFFSWYDGLIQAPLFSLALGLLLMSSADQVSGAILATVCYGNSICFSQGN